MPNIRSSADLRNSYNEISTFCHEYAEPVFITKNGKNIARLTSPTVNKLAVLDSLVGIVPKDSAMDEETIREERLARQ